MKFTSDLQVAKGRFLRIVFAASLLALVLLAAIGPASAQSSTYADNTYADHFGNSASLEGTWVFSIDILDGQQTVGTFNSLISFAGGGVVVTTPSIPPTSVFYGAWKCKRWDSCTAVFYTFVTDSSGKVGLQKASIRIHLAGPNNLVSIGDGATCDLQGENCVDQPGVFKSTGKRLGPKPE